LTLTLNIPKTLKVCKSHLGDNVKYLKKLIAEPILDHLIVFDENLVAAHMKQLKFISIKLSILECAFSI